MAASPLRSVAARTAALLLVALGVCVPALCAASDGVPGGFIRAEGKRLIAPDGGTFFVKGINIGHWLVPEGYMFRFSRNSEAPDQIRRVFERLLGRERAAAFWTRFRDAFVTADDIRFIADAGFNTIRVPLDYRLFVTAEDEPRFDGVGYALIDRLIGWARTAGLRVILDLHAAPGGQVGASHDGGSGYPLLFYVPANLESTVRRGETLARRYRDEPAVLGYVLLNELIAPNHDTK